jgi:hypothetical protein
MDENGTTVQINYRNFAQPLCLISLIFFDLYLILIFWMLIILFQFWLGSSLPFSIPGIAAILSPIRQAGLLLLVSLIGSILFVREMKVQSLRWKAGIPLCVLLGIIIVSGVLYESLQVPGFQQYFGFIALAGFVALPYPVTYLVRDIRSSAFDKIHSFSNNVGIVGLVLSVLLLLLSFLMSSLSSFVAFLFLIIFFCFFHVLILMPLTGAKLFQLGISFSKIPPAEVGTGGAAEPGPWKKISEVLRDIPRSMSPRVKWAILLVILLTIVTGGYYVYQDMTDTTPGRVWTKAAAFSPLTNRYGFTTVEFRGNLWAIGGNLYDGTNSEAWYTNDGSMWTPAPSAAMVPQRIDASSAVFKDALWVIGGQSVETRKSHNDVWYSGDGITWYEIQPAAEFSPRSGHGTAVFHDRIWVTGGDLGGVPGGNPVHNYTNEVWYSEDAIHWQQAPPSAGFSPRARHSLLVYDDQLWVLGGMDYTGSLNDVWKSTDGTSWTQVDVSAPFDPGINPGAVFDNRMWALANHGIWWSRDGVAWTAVKGSLPVPLTDDYLHSAPVVFDNRLWFFGPGSPMGGTWYTMPPG